jgi:hypothetical protein
MTIEQKALAIANEVRKEWGLEPLLSIEYAEDFADAAALCRAIEQHEAFKQEVSDKCSLVSQFYMNPVALEILETLIIPAPKPDPLVEVVNELDWADGYAAKLRAALEARGLEIREKGQ